MADALDDEWWLAPEPEKETEESQVKKRKKRPLSETIESDKSSTKKKNASGKKKKVTTHQKTIFGDLTQGTLWSFFKKENTGKLSPMEFSELMPTSEQWYLEADGFDCVDVTNFSSYLKAVIPDWKDKRKRVRKPGKPIVLVITSAATRAVELNRASNQFKGEDCRTAKLFGKHFKVDEQKTFLQKNITHFGIGTPGRIKKLFDADSLSKKKLRYVLIDWLWTDTKNRTIVNIPEVKMDLLNLLETYLFPLIRNGKLKIGLF